MDQDVKARWVAALRSGQYRQGKQQLRRGDNFCCLGVLCDISGVGEWEQRDRFVGYWTYRAADEINASVIPQAVQRWSGISHGSQQILTRMNDTGKSFDEIANHIEENY